MSLLGKILAGLNIVAAIAFACLVALDWGQRQKWTYAVFRQDLALNGLPVDDAEHDADGVRLVDQISDQTLKELFNPVGGGVPADASAEDKTQMGEVRRLKSRLDAEIKDAPDKRAKLLSLLTPLAPTVSERQALATKNVNILETQFNQAFGPDLLEVQGPQGQHSQKTQEDKRQAIAHLLVNLASPKPDATDYQRVLVVIGIKAFAREADRQAVVLRDMAQEVLLAMTRDQGNFLADHRQIVGELRELADTLAQRQAVLAEQTALTQRHLALVEDRKKGVEGLQNRIEQARRNTQAALAQLSQRQERLFGLEQQVKTTAEQNQELERKIRQLEKVTP
jgi:hypothetical protein